MATDRAEETRRQIVETALSLLRRFGEDKLTVVDIAKSLGMSHANVYRYFRNRTEILDAIIEEWMDKVQTFVEEIANRPGTAAERLELVLLELHRRRRQKLVEDPEVYETAKRVFEIRPEALERHREAVRNVFRQVLTSGIDSGEFRVMDVGAAAEILSDATVLFVHPLMIPTLLASPADVAERRTSRVVAAILAGFRN